MSMVLLEVRNLSCDTPMISLVLEGLSNGSFGHIEAELIANVPQRRATLFSCCAYEVSFVCRRELRWTPRARLIFSRTHDFILVPYVAYGGFGHIKFPVRLRNGFPGF